MAKTLHRFFQRDFPLRDQIGDDLRVVIDFKLPAEVGIVLLQGVVAVGTGGDDLLHVVVFHHLDIGLGQGLVEVFVPAPHGGIAAAPLLGPEDAEADPRRLQDLGEGRGDLLPPVVERSGAAHIEEVLHGGVFGEGLDAEVLRPVRPEVGADAPGVGVVLHVPVGELEFRREVRLRQDLVLPHPDDLGDVFDRCRAVLHAVHAVRAGPELVEIDHLADQCLLGRRWPREPPLRRFLSVLPLRFAATAAGACASQAVLRSWITFFGESGLPER